MIRTAMASGLAFTDPVGGDRLTAMLAMGRSSPWPDALQAFTGSREISGQAMVDYFAPLKTGLDQQNKGKPSGW